MPNNEVHSDHSYERYRVKARDLHRWMDEPSELYGISHRWSRHDTSFIPQIFIDKYGKDLALAIMEDHILLDKRSSNRETTIYKASNENSVFSFISNLLQKYFK